MGKTGKIEQFNLHELFQVIDYTCATGGLLVKGKKSIANVNFHQGEIVYIGVEGFKTRLGERMVEENFITAEQLRSMLLIQQRTKPWKPLGTLCIENKLLTTLSLQLVVHRQIVSLLNELLNWRQGMFKFEKGEVTVSDPISLSFFDYLNYQGFAQPQEVIVEDVSTPGELDKCAAKVRERFAAWKEDFFAANETVDYEQLCQLQALTELLRNRRPKLPRSILMDAVKTACVSLQGDSYLCILKDDGSYHPWPLKQQSSPPPDIKPADIKIDSGYFDQGKAGNFSVIPNLGGEIFSLPCAGKMLFCLFIKAAEKSMERGVYDSLTQKLRNLAIALNSAYLYK